MDSSSFFIGIHAGHDANVAVIDQNGHILYAAGEERFNRVKMFAGFPEKSLQYASNHFGPSFHSLATPRLPASQKVFRELNFFINSLRKGLSAPRFTLWLKRGMHILVKGRALESGSRGHNSPVSGKVLNVEHHDAHAASAFYPSGFENAYVMTLDGEGDGYSCCFYRGKKRDLNRYNAYFHNEVTIGRDYERVTAMLGFNPIRHPGKVTGLAAHGAKNDLCIEKLENYLDKSWHTKRHKVLGSQAAYQIIDEESRKELIKDRQTIFKEYSREELAFAIQFLTEQNVVNLIRKNIPDIESSNIALAGGVFANVALNKTIKHMGFQNIFIQPAMTDSGLSLGAAMAITKKKLKDNAFSHVYFGPSYAIDTVEMLLKKENTSYLKPDNPAAETAKFLADGKVVARFDGCMEFGPRALGNRSILYHTQDPSVNDWLNRQLSRSEFMPFAPVTLQSFAHERYHGYSGAEKTSKFMNITFDCTEKMKKESPAVVHVDGTARPQILSPQDNPGYAAILEEYQRLTGIPTLVNTSFNLHEEPIVMTPEDALKAFYASGLDALLMGPFLIVGNRRS